MDCHRISGGHDQFGIDPLVIFTYNITMTQTIDGIEYKVIPTEFNKKGFHYKCVRRDGMKAIYLQTRPGSNMCNYEVVKLGRHNGYVMGGSCIEPSETYPGSSLWGIAGWTCNDLDAANVRYNSL